MPPTLLNPELRAFPVVVGVDGGGTHTRAICVDASGRVLSWVQTGSAVVDIEPQAPFNILTAIDRAIYLAQVPMSAVGGIVGGIAGIQTGWHSVAPRRMLRIPGTRCESSWFSDSVVAHFARHGNRPGITIIAGTGCSIFGWSEEKGTLRLSDIGVTLRASAINIGRAALQRVATARFYGGHSDIAFARKVARRVGCQRIEQVAAELFRMGESAVREYAGRIAPFVTEMAEMGVPLAREVCDRAVQEIVTGVRSLGQAMAMRNVEYSIVGGVFRSGYIRSGVIRGLRESKTQYVQYNYVKGTLPPEGGAAMLAMAHMRGRDPEESWNANLARYVRDLGGPVAWIGPRACTLRGKGRHSMTKLGHNVREWLQKARRDASTVAVLIATGSLSPVHRMHVQMMEVARRHVERRLGYPVVGGWLSPSHEQQVRNKVGERWAISVRHRLRLCAIATRRSYWLGYSSWEASQGEAVEPLLVCQAAGRAAKRVIQREKRRAGRPKAITLKVIYVHGSDWAPTAVQASASVAIEFLCVERPTTASADARPSHGQHAPVHVVEDRSVRDVSSSDIRDRIGTGSDVTGLLPLGCWEYIVKHNIFPVGPKNAPPASPGRSPRG